MNQKIKEDKLFLDLFNEITKIITYKTNRVIKSIIIDGDSLNINITNRNEDNKRGLILPFPETYRMFKLNQLEGYLNENVVLYK